MITVAINILRLIYVPFPTSNNLEEKIALYTHLEFMALVAALMLLVSVLASFILTVYRTGISRFSFAALHKTSQSWLMRAFTLVGFAALFYSILRSLLGK
jgi:hypothetical protein